MKNKLMALTAIGVVLGISNVASADTAAGVMTVSATVGEACSVSASTMIFPTLTPFANIDVMTDTAGSLIIACTAATTPLIWSDTPRVLTGPGAGVVEIPFSLGQTNAAVLTNALPIIVAGEAIAAPFVADGTEQVVPMYGLIKAVDYTDKAPGLYSTVITINVNY
jgi:spore coat protein U-like protein